MQTRGAITKEYWSGDKQTENTRGDIIIHFLEFIDSFLSLLYLI